MENFIYAYKTKVLFGDDMTKNGLLEEIKDYRTVMIAYGGGSILKNGIHKEVTNLLKEGNKKIIEFSGIMPNPTYAKVQEGAKLARDNNVDFILAIGGGSVIDCCKIVASQAKTDTDIWTMEFVDHQMPTVHINMGAIVTATGTGAEMNCGAVITNEDLKIKAGVLGATPKFAILEPRYTMSVPFKQVISGAFDSLSHAMETYFGNSGVNHVSDDIALAVCKNIVANMKRVLADNQDMDARRNLMWDSAMAENGILKIGRKTDFQAHQIEHQLGAYTDCNHGQGLAVIHPAYYRHIVKDDVEKFANLAKTVFGPFDVDKTDEEIAEEGIERLADFIKECGLPTKLSELYSTVEITKELLKEVANSTNIIKTNVRELTHEEIYTILEECL